MSDAAIRAHNQEIVDQFSKQAISFEEKMRGDQDFLEMIVRMSGVSDSDRVLDVACGPGLVACAFGPHAKHVTGIDITPKMIERARQLQQGGIA